MTDWTASQHRCPICRSTLWQILEGDSVHIWCGYGPCPSVAANNGAHGATVAEAAARLAKRIDSVDEWFTDEQIAKARTK